MYKVKKGDMVRFFRQSENTLGIVKGQDGGKVDVSAGIRQSHNRGAIAGVFPRSPCFILHTFHHRADSYRAIILRSHRDDVTLLHVACDIEAAPSRRRHVGVFLHSCRGPCAHMCTIRKKWWCPPSLINCRWRSRRMSTS